MVITPIGEHCQRESSSELVVLILNREPDVRPYLLAVGRYALEQELGGKLGKRSSTEAERTDAIVQLGKDYLLWRWKKGDRCVCR